MRSCSCIASICHSFGDLSQHDLVAFNCSLTHSSINFSHRTKWFSVLNMSHRCGHTQGTHPTRTTSSATPRLTYSLTFKISFNIFGRFSDVEGHFEGLVIAVVVSVGEASVEIVANVFGRVQLKT